MFSSRNLIALVLVTSLIASDAMTFWHVGSCGDAACAAQCKSSVSGDGIHSHIAACEHDSNPFLKRRQRGAAESETTDTIAVRFGDSPYQSNHDPDDCSLCRWLVTARDPVVFCTPAVAVEVVEFPSLVNRAWTQPVSSPMLQDVSRRGPPVPHFFA